jgi:hypothetical protein
MCQYQSSRLFDVRGERSVSGDNIQLNCQRANHLLICGEYSAADPSPSIPLLAGTSTIMPVNARSQQNLKSRYKLSAQVRAVKQPESNAATLGRSWIKGDSCATTV